MKNKQKNNGKNNRSAVGRHAESSRRYTSRDQEKGTSIGRAGQWYDYGHRHGLCAFSLVHFPGIRIAERINA